MVGRVESKITQLSGLGLRDLVEEKMIKIIRALVESLPEHVDVNA